MEPRKGKLGFQMSPLRRELRNLKTKVQQEDFRLSQLEMEFWEMGGVCCPSCGIPGFSEARDAQERRLQRIHYLEKKLPPEKPKHFRFLYFIKKGLRWLSR